MQQDRTPRRSGVLAGRFTKWLALAIWLVLAGVLSPIGSHLISARRTTTPARGCRTAPKPPGS